MSYQDGMRIVTDNLVLYFCAASSKCFKSGLSSLNNLISNYGYTGELKSPIYVESGAFVSNSGYIQTNFSPNLDNNRNYTYSIWFKDNQVGGFVGNTALISNYSTATTPLSLLHIRDDGKCFFTERNSSSTLQEIVSTKSVVNSGWNNIVAVANKNAMYLYLNGELNISGMSRPSGTITSNQSFIIGGNHLGRLQTCWFDMPIVYLDKSFSREDVLQNFNATRGRFNL
jgi:hypothetical protein